MADVDWSALTWDPQYGTGGETKAAGTMPTLGNEAAQAMGAIWR